MASSAKNQFPELREFVKEHDQRLFDFCCYLLEGGSVAEEVVLGTFSEFGTAFRKAKSRSFHWDPQQMRVELYQIAWRRVRETLSSMQYAWSIGRDTRQFKSFERDLLSEWKRHPEAVEKFDSLVVERLGKVDPDFRAPVVLRDILKFPDEEVAQILDLRWGVYRHRLHRGRMELKDGLRGNSLRDGLPAGQEPVVSVVKAVESP